MIPRLRSRFRPPLVAASAAAAAAPVVSAAAPVGPLAKNVVCVGKNYHEHAKEFSESGFDGSAAGVFVLPAGASDGTAGWKVNKPTVAKYVNKLAPSRPTQAKVGVVTPGKLLELVGRCRERNRSNGALLGAPSNHWQRLRLMNTFDRLVYKKVAQKTAPLTASSATALLPMT